MDTYVTAKIGYLFFGKIKRQIPTAAQIKAVLGDDTQSETDNPTGGILSDIKTGVDFLYGGQLKFPCRRYVKPEIVFTLPNVKACDGHLIVTVYDDSKTIEVAVNFTAVEATVDDIVYLRQIFTSDAQISGKLSIKGLAAGIFELCGIEMSKAEIAFLTEINDFCGIESLPDIFSRYSAQIYGIMTGDEGYGFVSPEMIESRLDNRWSTRDFVSAVVFRNNFLLMNINKGAHMSDYLERQRDFGGEFYGSPNPYFFINPITAGVNHGILFSCEMGMVAKTISSGVLERQSSKAHKRGKRISTEIRETKLIRRDLILTLNRLGEINIAEMGELDRMIINELDINPLVEKIKYLLELVESDLNLLYSTSTNTLVNILTVCGLLLAAAQVILAIFL